VQLEIKRTKEDIATVNGTYEADRKDAVKFLVDQVNKVDSLVDLYIKNIQNQIKGRKEATPWNLE